MAPGVGAGSSPMSSASPPACRSSIWRGCIEGPIAHALGDVDISWAPGLLVAGVVYYLINGNLDLSAEQAAITASNKALGYRSVI